MQIEFITVNKPETKITLKSAAAGSDLTVSLSSADGGMEGLTYSLDGVNYQPATASISSASGTIYLETKSTNINSSLRISSSQLTEVDWGKAVKYKGLSFQSSLKLTKVPTFLWDACTSLKSMFYGCTVFNQDISGWNTSNVTNMTNMFNGCKAFNQNLSGWNVAKVTYRTSFDAGATLWQANYKPLFA